MFTKPPTIRRREDRAEIVHTISDAPAPIFWAGFIIWLALCGWAICLVGGVGQ